MKIILRIIVMIFLLLVLYINIQADLSSLTRLILTIILGLSAFFTFIMEDTIIQALTRQLSPQDSISAIHNSTSNTITYPYVLNVIDDIDITLNFTRVFISSTFNFIYTDNILHVINPLKIHTYRGAANLLGDSFINYINKCERFNYEDTVYYVGDKYVIVNKLTELKEYHIHERV